MAGRASNSPHPLSGRSESLPESESFFRKVVEESPHGVVIHQAARICFANPAIARMLRYSRPEELIGCPAYATLAAPEDHAMLAARSDALYRGESLPPTCGWRALPRDGSELWVITLASVIQWLGQPAILAFFRDITEERRAVQSLRERETLLRSITDNTEDIVFVKDTESRFLFMNPAGFRANGLTPEDLLGHTDAECHCSPEQAAAFREADLRVMQARRTEIIEEEFLSSTGQRHVWVTSKSPRFDEAGQVIGIVGVARDITEERRLQREILEIAAAEDRRIGQDLHDGAGQELTGLAYMSETLLDRLQAQASPESEIAERIVAAVKRVQSQVRGYARGLIPVDVDADGLRVALERLAANTESASGRHCSFECRQLVGIDNNQIATQLYRIAQEAVTNVLRHANAEQIAITLDAEDSAIILSISDDGVGLAPEQTNDGFGLKIMQYRASLVGGSLSVRSQDAAGTQVVCRLPISDHAD